MLSFRNPGNRFSDKLWSNTPKLGAYDGTAKEEGKGRKTYVG